MNLRIHVQAPAKEHQTQHATTCVRRVQIKYTPMHAAAAAGQVGCLLLMIEAGALVDEEVRGAQLVVDGAYSHTFELASRRAINREVGTQLHG